MTTPTAPDDADRPYRVVSAKLQGWYLTSSGLYDPDWGRERGLPAKQTLEQIAAAAGGPNRPVEPMTTADDNRLRIMFDKAGRRTIATLASALEELFHQIREAHGGLASATSYDTAKSALTAGRGGSWEAALLQEVVFFGNELNLPKAKRGQPDTIEARRAVGPGRRVDRDVRDELLMMLRRWVIGSGPFVEVAETLAAEVSMYADDTYGADGWRGVADQWLQPGALDTTNSSVCYRLFYSQSRHYNTSLFW